MKRSTIIIIIIAAVCVIAVCLLFFLGVIPFPLGKKETVEQTPEMYVEYMGGYMLIDGEGYVIGSVLEMPEDIPEINGVSFSNIIVGEKLEPEDEAAFEYARKIVKNLNKNEVFMNKIYVSSDLTASMYINNVRVLLGEDNKTEDKIKEMSDFYDDFKDLSGTLDMQELSTNNLGYSLKPN